MNALQSMQTTSMALVLTIGELQRRVVLLERENAKLREQSHRDTLTGLFNRRGFEGEAQRTLDGIQRYGGAMSMLAIDLDGLKQLNDRYGHPAGDAALISVAAVMQEALRSTDIAARLGGDEFAIILPSTSLSGAAVVAERIRRFVARVDVPGTSRLTASIGIAGADGAMDRLNYSDLYARADAALYRAKHNGRNRLETEREASMRTADLAQLTEYATSDLPRRLE